jgi:hypothetical protein
MSEKEITWNIGNEEDVIRASKDIKALENAGYIIQPIAKGKVLATKDQVKANLHAVAAAGEEYDRDFDEMMDDAEARAKEYDEAIQEGMDHAEKLAEEAAEELKGLEPKATIISDFNKDTKGA